jgi:isoleucyl-tRNA synthetase
MFFKELLKMNYSKTINLPKTAFPMRANLSQREPEFLKFWEDNKIYEKMLEKNKENKPFILHDGPPYANGKIHIGHALNKILKDIVIKFKSLDGFYTPFVPGWDCHGMPIEHKVLENLGPKHKEMSKLEIRTKCKYYALKHVDIQKKDFKRLGVFGHWEEPYLTLNHKYEAAIIKMFGELVDKNFIYKGLKPVHWCSSCETALADAEVEYADHTSSSIYVSFKVKNKNNIDLPDNTNFIMDNYSLDFTC